MHLIFDIAVNPRILPRVYEVIMGNPVDMLLLQTTLAAASRSRSSARPGSSLSTDERSRSARG